ncbi:retrovirus-related pol polyprotein from transposon TNT 1-94, partial [Tanacetum coccineum]
MEGAGGHDKILWLDNSDGCEDGLVTEDMEIGEGGSPCRGLDACFCSSVLRTDNGGEFCSKVFDTFCEHQGIHRELTSPYTPEQNGIAERKNRTVMEMARSMLKEKKLPDNLWAEAVATAVYLLNLSPTEAVLNRTPFEAWRGVKPSENTSKKWVIKKGLAGTTGGGSKGYRKGGGYGWYSGSFKVLVGLEGSGGL